MKADIEKYIGGLDPVLQGKARQCKTKEELSAFIADNDLELPEDALELVSGGCGTSTPKKPYCKYCGTAVYDLICQDSHKKGMQSAPYVCWNGCGRHLNSNEVEWR
ncbi:hypothetical protein SAMN02910353_01354 [Ruminococcus sp. YRD2003]|uniref:hypothetical protein n=1 Tax=Ruminococcus sp. YRD2003 TaxID=1452313 RepID=UPI0008CE9CAE|nr:hypothetical protein SAMN02910353_01354 [Ruminococcus flavefaciens]